MTSVYLRRALDQVNRLVSRCNREPFSSTYGSFDRTHWGWKFTDFPGARFQEAAYALAWLYRTNAPGNPLFAHPDSLEWTRAAIAYWRRLQYPDGSFDEAYPFERSLAATAFTAFYLGEALSLIGDKLEPDERRESVEVFRRAGDWLCRNDETHGVLSNHLAVAAAALAVIERITNEPRYGVRCRHFLDRIYARQSPEGWYEEYGGADIGYQTHGIFYLARIWQMSGDATLLESLRAAIGFLKHFVHPDRTIGGEYGSRNTEFYFPAGFEILASVLPDAAAIAGFLRPSVAAGGIAGLTSVDAYNFLPLLNNHLFAHDAAPAADAAIAVAENLPCQKDGAWDFPDAGLYVRGMATRFVVVGASKGGVVKVFERTMDGARLRISDCGWWATSPSGAISSQTLNRPARATVTGGSFVVSGRFARVNQTTMTPWLFVAFRLFCLTFGRSAWIARWIKSILVKTLVSRRVVVPLSLERRIVMEPDGLRIVDRIVAERKVSLSIDRIAPGRRFSAIHMGSARYFQPPDMTPSEAESGISSPTEAARELKSAGTIVVERFWPTGRQVEMGH